MKNELFLISVYDMPYEDDEDEILKEIYLKEDVIHLKKAAEELNLHCLRWISEESKTFFNGKQAYEIELNELPILQKDQTLNKKLLQHIEQMARAIAREGYYFIKIEPRF